LHDHLVQAGAEIRVKLAAYYGRSSSITRDWMRFSSAVTSFIRLGSSNISDRPGFVKDVRAYLGDDTVAEIPEFDRLNGQPETPRFHEAYSQVHDALTLRLIDVSERVVDEHPQGYSNWIPFI